MTLALSAAAVAAALSAGIAFWPCAVAGRSGSSRPGEPAVTTMSCESLWAWTDGRIGLVLLVPVVLGLAGCAAAALGARRTLMGIGIALTVLGLAGGVLTFFPQVFVYALAGILLIAAARERPSVAAHRLPS